MELDLGDTESPWESPEYVWGSLGVSAVGGMGFPGYSAPSTLCLHGTCGGASCLVGKLT